MNKKKINPRRRPASMADVNRAKAEAENRAIKRALLLVLWNLVDKHSVSMEELQQLAQEINYTADSIGKGYLSWNDIERTLYVEYEFELDLH